MTPNCDRASGLTLEDIAVLRDGTPQACRTEVYRRDRQPEDTLGASAADEERLQLYQTYSCIKKACLDRSGPERVCERGPTPSWQGSPARHSASIENSRHRRRD